MEYGIPSWYNIVFSAQYVSADFEHSVHAYSEIQTKCF